MKRIILYTAVLGLMLAAPAEQMNVGKLIPVQAISIYKQDEQYVIETDTQNKGVGNTPEQALQNMKETASGIIYLDTAQYLLFSEDAQHAVDSLREKLKGSVKLSAITAPVNMENVSQFLDAHDKLPKLKHWKAGMNLPVLSMFEESYNFFKKVEKRA